MERIYTQGRDPQAYTGLSKSRESRINLVEQFVTWVEEPEAASFVSADKAAEVRAARDEFYHPIWKILGGRSLPSNSDLIFFEMQALAQWGLLKFDRFVTGIGKAACGKAFPAQTGDLKSIAQGVSKFNGVASLDSLMVLAIEYRHALDRFQPTEGQIYLDSFVETSRRFTANIEDEYIGNGIASLIALRMLRNDWSAISPEKWRRASLKGSHPLDLSNVMTRDDSVWDMFNRGPQALLPIDKLRVEGAPIVAPDEKMMWFVENLNRIMVALRREATGGLPAVMECPENWRELLDTARNLWGEYEPAAPGFSFIFVDELPPDTRDPIFGKPDW